MDNLASSRVPGRNPAFFHLRFVARPSSLAIGLLCFLLAIPVLTILSSVTSSSGGVWQHLYDTLLLDYVRDSALLMLGVGALVLVLGVLPAWLLTMTRFPGSRILEWANLSPEQRSTARANFRLAKELSAKEKAQEFLERFPSVEFVDVAAVERGAVVAVHTILERGDVDLDQVTVLQWAGVGDAVADDLVDAGADGLGEAAVVQRGRICAVVQHVLVSDVVQLVGGDPGRDGLGSFVHGLRRDPPRHPHGLHHLGWLHVGSGVRFGRLAAHVVGLEDVRGDLAFGGQGMGNDSTHVGKSR